MRKTAVNIAVITFVLVSSTASAEDLQAHELHSTHLSHQHQIDSRDKMYMAATDSQHDAREVVKFPAKLYAHTLSNMRNHLETLHKINDQLSRGDFSAAGGLAEESLGMSSLKTHGSHEVAKYMPSGMAALGTRMHKSASQFAIVAQDAAVTGDYKSTLKALGKVTESCVACHGAYRLSPK